MKAHGGSFYWLGESWKLLFRRGEVFTACFLAMLLYCVVGFGLTLFCGTPLIFIFSAIFSGGIYLAFFRAIDGESVGTGTGFDGFSFFGPLLGSCLLQYLALGLAWAPVIGLFAVLDVFEEASQGPELLAILVLAIVGILIHTPMIFSYGLIVDREAGVWESIVWSMRAFRANAPALLLLQFMAALIYAFSSTCCLPIVIGMPWVIGAQAVAMAEIMPRQKLLDVFD